jgi:hypothetical protein
MRNAIADPDIRADLWRGNQNHGEEPQAESMNEDDVEELNLAKHTNLKQRNNKQAKILNKAENALKQK